MRNNTISSPDIRDDDLSSSAYDHENLLNQSTQSLEMNPSQTASSIAGPITRDGRTKECKAMKKELNKDPNRKAMVRRLNIEEEKDTKVQASKAELKSIDAVNDDTGLASKVKRNK